MRQIALVLAAIALILLGVPLVAGEEPDLQDTAKAANQVAYGSSRPGGLFEHVFLLQVEEPASVPRPQSLYLLHRGGSVHYALRLVGKPFSARVVDLSGDGRVIEEHGLGRHDGH